MVRTRWAALAVAISLGTLAGCATSRPFGHRANGDAKPAAYPDVGVPVSDGPIISDGPATFTPGPMAPPSGAILSAPPLPPGAILSAPPGGMPGAPSFTTPAPAGPAPPVGPQPREVPQPVPTGRTAKGAT